MLSILLIIYDYTIQNKAHILTYILTYLLIFLSQYTCDPDKTSSRYTVHVADQVYLCDSPRKVVNVDAANNFYNPRGTLVCRAHADLCVVVSIDQI